MPSLSVNSFSERSVCGIIGLYYWSSLPSSDRTVESTTSGLNDVVACTFLYQLFAGPSKSHQVRLMRLIIAVRIRVTPWPRGWASLWLTSISFCGLPTGWNSLCLLSPHWLVPKTHLAILLRNRDYVSKPIWIFREHSEPGIILILLPRVIAQIWSLWKSKVRYELIAESETAVTLK